MQLLDRTVRTVLEGQMPDENRMGDFFLLTPAQRGLAGAIMDNEFSNADFVAHHRDTRGRSATPSEALSVRLRLLSEWSARPVLRPAPRREHQRTADAAKGKGMHASKGLNNEQLSFFYMALPKDEADKALVTTRLAERQHEAGLTASAAADTSTCAGPTMRAAGFSSSGFIMEASFSKAQEACWTQKTVAEVVVKDGQMVFEPARKHDSATGKHVPLHKPNPRLPSASSSSKQPADSQQPARPQQQAGSQHQQQVGPLPLTLPRAQRSRQEPSGSHRADRSDCSASPRARRGAQGQTYMYPKVGAGLDEEDALIARVMSPSLSATCL